MSSGATPQFAPDRPTGATAARDAAWKTYLARCAARDESALEALYDESSSLVYSVALRVLDSPADAEEVTLDVYRQVWQIAGQYHEQRASVASWLVMQARTRAIDRRRARQSRPQLQELYSESWPAGEVSNPERRAATSQIQSRLSHAMATLSIEERECLQQAFVLGMSHSEIAARTKKPLGTVKTRIRTGMIRLRNLLGDIQ